MQNPDRGARLAALRQEIAARGWAGFLAPRADRHQGEYVSPADERLAWLTGFTGSAGAAVVLADAAALFVDGRYDLQAAAQLKAAFGPEPPFDVVKMDQRDEASRPENWAAARLEAGARFAVDPWLTPAAGAERWSAALAKAGAELAAASSNPLDAIWRDRPSPPDQPAKAYDPARAGRSAEHKRAEITALLTAESLDAVLITEPTSIAWLLNLRGDDLPHTPVFLGYALVFADGAIALYTDAPKLTDALAADLGGAVREIGFEALAGDLAALAGRRVALAKATAPWAAETLLREAGAHVVWRADPCALPRAKKTAAEIAGARAAHQRDGAAMAEILAWIDRAAPSGALTEQRVFEEIVARRAAVGERLGAPLQDTSFDAIVGFAAHGAIVHYRVTPDTNLPIVGDGLLLIDSGGQYLDGTTDITRTIAVGGATSEEKEAATRVLKGLIAISTLHFPPGVRGREIDAFARAALWRAGLDYSHGTGHGVGAYLSVHEGPQSLSPRGEAALEAGMILSNEPGCYREGAFGVRLENLILVRDAAAAPDAPADAAQGWRKPMRSFETLTLAPFDRRILEPALLNAEERAWLDAYHARVAQEIAPLLGEEARAWLLEACKPI